MACESLETTKEKHMITQLPQCTFRTQQEWRAEQNQARTMSAWENYTSKQQDISDLGF